MAGEWHPRPYREEDAEVLRKLYAEVFQEPVSAEVWAWRYHQNPLGYPIIMVAEAGGALVGQCAMVPLRMKVGEEQCVGTLALNVMTHPDYQGRGIFTGLASQAQERAAELGAVLTYGFPNENARPAWVRRLGWKDLCPAAPIYVRPLKVASVLRAKFGKMAQVAGPLVSLAYLLVARPRGRASRSAWQVAAMREFDQRWDALWERVAPRLPIAVVRDQAYLRWRYTRHPEARYEVLAAESQGHLGGYCVLRDVDRFGLHLGFVMDLLAEPDRSSGVVDALMERVLQIARERRYDALVCMMMPGSPWLSAVRRWGFMKVPPRFYPDPLYLGGRSLSSRYDQEFVTNPQAWYITWGDHDSL